MRIRNFKAWPDTRSQKNFAEVLKGRLAGWAGDLHAT
jgi:hypothetical protein